MKTLVVGIKKEKCQFNNNAPARISIKPAIIEIIIFLYFKDIKLEKDINPKVYIKGNIEDFTLNKISNVYEVKLIFVLNK